MSGSPEPAFPYPEVGATRGPLPAGYDHLEVRRELGHGEELFRRLGDAVLAYRIQRGLGILRSADTPTAQPGSRVTVRLGLGPLGIPAPCRVVYVLDEPEVRGFAYGTLPGHPALGEERFAVEYDRATGVVTGVVTAFSRPAAWYTRLAGPLTPLAQRVAARAYLAVLRRTPEA